MKKIFLGFVLMFHVLIVNTAVAQSRDGKITGKVVTKDGREAQSGIVVNLVNTKSKAATDEYGKFEFSKIAFGDYSLSIQIEGKSEVLERVSVTSDQPVKVTIRLPFDAQELEEVIVKSQSNKINTNTLSSSLRLGSNILEVPQNIEVVTGTALAQQQITSMSDGVIRNVSGAVRLEHWGDLYTNIQMRGSQVQAFRNGFNVVASYWGPLTEDMSFVDRIEFVKGPAGFMLANGDPSGLYNVVTKKPTGVNKGEVSFTGGSFDFYRGTLDIDRKLTKDGKLLFRVNAAAQKKGSFRPFEHNDRYSIAPVLSYRFNNRTKLTLEYTWQKAVMTDVGSYYVFSTEGYATLPRDFTLMQPGLPKTKINDHSFFLNFQHELSDNWKLTAQVAYFKYNQIGSSAWPSYIGTNGDVIRSIGIWDANSTMKLGQAFVNGTVQTGKVRHKILAGIDAGKKDYIADWGQSHNLDTEDDPFNVYNPDYGTPPNGFPDFDRTTSLKERAKASGGLIGQEYASGYVQDELGFFKNVLRLTVAGRYSYVKQYEWGGDPYQARRFSPRIGLSYSIDQATSVYAVYDQAFVPQSGILRSGKTPAPITGNNMELGAKRDWFDGKWNTTLAIYQITKNNELTSDPTNAAGENYSIIVGQKRVRGIEFDLKGEIVKGLDLVANYAFTNSKVTKVAEGVTDMNVGDVVPGFAKHTSNAWLNYSFQEGALKGFGLNAGFTYLVGRAIQNYNPEAPAQNIPDYFKLDGGIFWQHKKYSITANMFNILNKYLYSGAYYTGYWNAPNYDLGVYSWQAEPPRNFRVTLTYKF
ncbi:MAG: TonB-dependent siderophore receptor [Chitinophagaceae bacterium]